MKIAKDFQDRPSLPALLSMEVGYYFIQVPVPCMGENNPHFIYFSRSFSDFSKFCMLFQDFLFLFLFLTRYIPLCYHSVYRQLCYVASSPKLVHLRSDKLFLYIPVCISPICVITLATAVPSHPLQSFKCSSKHKTRRCEEHLGTFQCLCIAQQQLIVVYY